MDITSDGGTVTFAVRSLDGRYSYDVTRGIEIGRRCEMSEYLDGKELVSRRHAVLFIKDGELYVIDVGNLSEDGRNLGSTNGTYINGEPIEKLRAYRLANRDRLSLGGRESDTKLKSLSAHFMVLRKR